MAGTHQTHLTRDLSPSVQVPVSEYVDFVTACQPNVFECLCDSVSSETNKLKRIRKSVDRTLRFLDSTLLLKRGSLVSRERESVRGEREREREGERE